jgi:hypothetical protein
MRITLNLATRPYADIGPALKRLRIAMAVLVVIGIGLGLGLRALPPAGRRCAQNGTTGTEQDRRHQPGAAGLPGSDAPAGQRRAAEAGYGA